MGAPWALQVAVYPERPGATLAALYFANSLGGAIGVLTSGFVRLRLLGLPYTRAVAGLMHLGLAGGTPAPRVVAAADRTSGESPGRLPAGSYLSRCSPG